ncbi:MAG: DUF885 domain-containing protein [Pseudomonadota bacterium]
MRALVLSAALLFAAGVSHAKVDDGKLQKIIDKHWAYTLEQDPLLATSVGVRDYDQQLGSLSLKNMDKRKGRLEKFLGDLEKIEEDRLSDGAKLNKTLLEGQLRTDVAALSYPQRAMLFTRFYGWHFTIANLPDQLPFFTMADYESYISRLNDVSRYNSEGMATTRWAIQNGMTLPCVSLTGYERTITGQITQTAEASRFWEPFNTRPNTIDRQNWKRLKAMARTAINDRVMPDLRTWADVFTREYMPACQQEVGASQLSRGTDFYQHRVKRYTTLSLAPRQIHQTGLSEVSRIRREMQAVMDDVNFTGSIDDFLTFLRTDPRFYAKSGEELLQKTALIAKKADGGLPALFGTLPRMPYTVKPIPAALAEGNTTAYYEQPAGDGTRPGVYRVNLTSLDQRPLFELEALTLHEAVPGHHLQLALQQELTDIPNFRRFGDYTAFIEGWGLYAERLGLDMGFYEDPYANFGRLSYEMWRACRLVVDTGLHMLGWSRDQSIDYMAYNTALSQENIEAEVDRYITWPGQALAYKTGEMKIVALRDLARKTLGDSFDIRAFHDTVLGAGALPLSALESRVHSWIEANGGQLPKRKQPQEERSKRKRVKR